MLTPSTPAALGTRRSYGNIGGIACFQRADRLSSVLCRVNNSSNACERCGWMVKVTSLSAGWNSQLRRGTVPGRGAWVPRRRASIGRLRAGPSLLITPAPASLQPCLLCAWVRALRRRNTGGSGRPGLKRPARRTRGARLRRLLFRIDASSAQASALCGAPRAHQAPQCRSAAPAVRVGPALRSAHTV